MGLDYSITASSKDEYERIERVLKEFDKFYGLSHQGLLQAKSLVDNIIQIFPEREHGIINEVFIKNKELKGYLLKSTPEFSLILLGENRFDIQYKNPHFKKE